MPSKPSVLQSTGLFTEDKRAAEKFRDKLAADALEKFTRMQSDRWRQERQWYLNLAFYFGQHYVKFRSVSPSNFDLYVPPAPYYKVRPTINHVRKVIRREIARLTAQKPNAYVMPASTDDRDIFAAQAGEQIWDSLWRKHKFNRVLRQAVFWQAVCGNGFVKQYWDWTKKDNLNEEDGDICMMAVTPFHVYVPDLKEENIEEQPYVMHAQVRPKEWIRNYLGVEPDDRRMSEVDTTLLNIMGINQLNKKDLGIVLEVWMKPGIIPNLPEGAIFTIAATQIVQGFEGWPYSHNQYPLSKLDAIPTGKFYNDSILTDLIPLQRELNRTRGQITEAKNRMAKPQLSAEEGSIRAASITSEPGQIIFYKMGYQRPEPIPMQNLPSYVGEEVNRIYTDIADLSGQHEVSQGTTPPGLTAATAISFLEEQDESMISVHFDSLEEAIEKTAFQCLTYVKDYWDEERTIKIVGVDRSFDVQTFKGSDLRDNTDIRVEAGSALPTSRAAKQAFIMDLMKMGFIPPQEGLEIMEIGGLNRIYERIQVDVRQAQRENLKMAVTTEQDLLAFNEAWLQEQQSVTRSTDDNQPLQPPLIIPVNTWDNHQVHIEIHNRYRKSQSFTNATRVTRILFEEHVKMHMEAMAGMLPNPTATPPPEQGEMPPSEEMQEFPNGQNPGPAPMPEGV